MLSPVNCARPVLNRDWLLLSSPEFRREPTVTDVMRVVSECTGIARSKLRSHRRKPEITRARAMVCYLAREYTAVSWPTLGRMLCKDHTTAIYAAEAAERYMARDEAYRRQVSTVAIKLLAGVA